MTEIQRIEQRVLELTSTFDMRPTLERAADIGDLLMEARSMIQHGEWADWLARLGLKRRTAWDYIAVAKAKVAYGCPCRLGPPRYRSSSWSKS